MTIEIEDLRLQWPAELFTAEAEDLLRSGYAGDTNAVKLLFCEAFAEGTGEGLVGEVCGTSAYRGRWQPGTPFDDPWNSTEINGMRSQRVPPSKSLLEETVRRVQEGNIPTFAPKRYWSKRRHVEPEVEPLSEQGLREAFMSLLCELEKIGYLDQATGPNCCDYRGDRIADGESAIQQRTGKKAVWPSHDLGPAWWRALPDDELFDLIEVFFDLVQRPRKSYWHDFCDEWDYGEYDQRAGQRVYLWRTNQLLARSTTNLRLSAEGEDRGLLIRVVPDERANLPHRVAAAARDDQERTRIEHSIASQRSRHPTRESRREAVRSLADVLENRREEAKTMLGRRDESSLFQIINGFDLRHMNQFQQADYGEEFLDYFFWTLLSTLDLLDRLAERKTKNSDPMRTPQPVPDATETSQ
ncbi:hypothetical protein GA0111570_1208 [Raineyella antarctica]|uniref:Uncharacterized protein n=1 Tax=Raineyella antarctica TaxID=1577474 RepID=A0A1G6IPD4_9ACTN|nr:hypothetical protein [Raineyella antarctica]SDC08348.1 hypothetical protein GA0111570_1208 [Raineyella antarctica]